MSAPVHVAKLPRPALFALTGALAALLVALTAGELVWYLLHPNRPESHPKPAPPVEPHTEPPHNVPVPQLAISAAPVAAYPGGKNTFGVRIARDKLEGPVTVRFDTPGGLRVAEISIPADATVGRAEVEVPPDVKPGTYTVTATTSASAEERTYRASVAVRVTVPALPPLPARMAVSASPKVQAYQKGRNTFGVRVVRAEFDDAVTVTFEGSPDGVKVPAITIPAGMTEATAELTADASAKIGSTKLTVTARAAPNGVALSAASEIVAEINDPTRAPLDLVLVLDCTGSMKRSVEGLSESLPALGIALQKTGFDVRFGLVGFRDTTLGQPLETPNIGAELMGTDVRRLAAAVRGRRLGGGGGEGESSLDGIGEAANFPLRVSAPRVILLVTDGPPKRSDGVMKSIDLTMKYLRAKRIDQLHIVALSEHRKRFEPLFDGAKGNFYDLKAATAGDTFGKLMADLAKAIAEAVPPQPAPKPEPSPTSPGAVLPELAPVKPPAPPAAREPDEPQFAPPVPPAPTPAPATPEKSESAPTPEAPERKSLALAAWATTVTLLACLVLYVAQQTFLPGERPTDAVAATGYGSGLVLGLVAGALGYVALDAVGVPLLARLGGACLFGLGAGAVVPLAEQLFRVEANVSADAAPVPPPLPLAPLPSLPPLARPARVPVPELDLPPVEAYPTSPKVAPAPMLDLDLPPVEAYSTALTSEPPAPPAPPLLSPPAVPVHKPNITGAPKPGDGCPQCGRKIPGEIGTRYCMLCDTTF